MPYTKWAKTLQKLGNIEIEKQKFQIHKIPVLVYNVDINKTVVSSKVSFDKNDVKCFVEYKDDKQLKAIMAPKLSAYRRGFDETKYMSFLIKNDELLEKYNEI